MRLGTRLAAGFLGLAAVLGTTRWCEGAVVVDPLTIRTTITGRTASTTMEFVLRNADERAEEEASLSLELPVDAAVHEMALWVDGVRCPAAVLPQMKARQVYEQYVTRRRDPAILEYQGRGQWSLQVFPVPAKGERKVQIAYCQLLHASPPWIDFQGPELTSGARTVDVTVEVRAPGGVKDLLCHSHDAGLQRLGSGAVRLGFRLTSGPAEAGGASVRPVRLSYRPERDVPEVATFTTAQGQRYFVAALPPTDLLKPQAPARHDVVILLDHSASTAPSILLIGQQTAAEILDGLGKEDRFGVVASASDAVLWKPALVPATPENVAAARKFISGLRGRGGTDLAAGLRAAASLADKTARMDLFVLSHGWDLIGAPSMAADAVEAVREKLPAPPANVRIHCYDPMGSSWGMWALSQRTGGLYARMADNSSQIFETTADLRNATFAWTFPVDAYRGAVVTDTSVTGPEGSGLAAILGDDQPGLVIGRAGKASKVDLKLRGRVDGVEASQAVTVKLPEASQDNQWVTPGEMDRVAALLRSETLWHRLNATKPGLGDMEELFDICRTAGIAGVATSLLVLESDQEYARRGILREPTTLKAGLAMCSARETWTASGQRARAAEGKGAAAAALKARAAELRKKGDVEKALASLKDAAKLTPDDAEIAEATSLLEQFLALQQGNQQGRRARDLQTVRRASVPWTDTMMTQEASLLAPAAAEPPRALTPAESAKAPVDPAKAPAQTREQELRRKLLVRLPVLNVQAVKFKDFLRQLSEAAGVNIHAQWNAMLESDVGPDMPVTLSMKDVTPEKALDLVLADLSAPQRPVTWRVEDNVVVITSRRQAAEREAAGKVTRVYDVRRMLMGQPREAAQMGLVLSWVPTVSENSSALVPVWDVAKISPESEAMARMALGNVVSGPAGGLGMLGAGDPSGRPFVPDFMGPRIDVARLGRNMQSSSSGGIFGSERETRRDLGIYGGTGGTEEDSIDSMILGGEDFYGLDRVRSLLNLCRQAVQGDVAGTFRFRDGMLVVTHTPAAQAALERLLAGLNVADLAAGAPGQRSVQSIAVESLFTTDGRCSEWVGDLLAKARDGKLSAFSSVQVCRAGRRTFARIGGYWFDTGLVGSDAVIDVITPTGPAGEAILKAAPDLKAAAALGPRVIVSFGPAGAVCFDAKSGGRMDEAKIKAIVKAIGPAAK